MKKRRKARRQRRAFRRVLLAARRGLRDLERLFGGEAGQFTRQNEEHEQRVDNERLDKSQTDNHRGLDGARRFGLTGHALNGAVDGDALTDARANNRDRKAKAGSKCEMS